MSGTKVSGMTAITAMTDDDLLYAIDAANASRKITYANFKADFVLAPASSTENKVPQWDSTSLTLKDGLAVGTAASALVQRDGSGNFPYLKISDSATQPPMNLTERSSEPSAPASGDIYLDDGTNTSSTEPGFRRYTGAAWEDIGGGGGAGGHTIQEDGVSRDARTNLNFTAPLTATDDAGNDQTDIAITTTSFVMKALFDANTILAADSDDTPAALTVGEQSIVGRITGGNIDALTAEETWDILQTVEANTAESGSPNVIATSENHKIFTNEGATAANYHTLPSAEAGLVLTFIVEDADGMRITANTGDTINLNGVVTKAAGYVSTTTQYARTTLMAINATQWIGVDVFGSWTVETS